MTNAAKWKEFLRWWTDEEERLSDMWGVMELINEVRKKIKELQKGDNAKQ